VGLLLPPLLGAASSPTSFTVRDAIGLATLLDFDTPGGERTPALFSPGRSSLVVHTRRGDLARNVNVDALLLFSVRDLRAVLSSPTSTPPPRPRTLVTVDAHQPWDGISHVAWQDEDELCFTAKLRSPVIQAFSINVRNGHLTQLTRSPADVTSFAVGAGRIVYYARASQGTGGPRHVDYQSFGELIEPDGAAARSSPVVELFTEPRAEGPVRRVDMPPSRLSQLFQRIWIAPAGDYAVGFRPTAAWPPSWATYQVPHNDLFGYSADRMSGDPASPEVANRVQYQLIDLRTGRARALVDAPGGFLAQNDTPAAVFWTSDRPAVIVTNTFLPLGTGTPGADDARRLGPFIAEVGLASGAVTEIVQEPHLTPDIERGVAPLPRIVSVQWDPAAGLLTVRRQLAGREIESQGFRVVGGAWRAVPAGTPAAASTPDVAVGRAEGLNERLTLEVRGGVCACHKLLYDPNPGAGRFAFGRAEVRQWTDPNGIAWRGGLVYPTGYVKGRAYPLVVQTHGFNPDQFLVDGPDGYTTAFAAQALATAGFLVLQVEDNRRAMTLDEREGPLYAAGYHAGIDTLVAEGLADPARIGLIGFSRTGWHTLHLLKQYPGLLSAVTMADAGLVGYVADLLSVNFSADFRLQFRKVVGGIATPEDWMARSPMYQLASLDTPVRLEANDPGSAIATWELYALLRSADRPVDFVYFPGGQHILFSPENRLESQGGNVDWFRFWLQGYEDPDPRKADQYRRWRTLRTLQAAHRKARESGPDRH
jgi:dienelactone hydrolase